MGSGFQYRRFAHPVADVAHRRTLRQTLHGESRLSKDANATSTLVRWIRLLRIGGLVLSGVATVFLIFPWVSLPRQRRLKQRWSRTLLGMLGVQLEADLSEAVAGSLLVANHVSFLDIYVVNAARPVAFVSKAEVRQWPLIGWLASASETIFLKRGSRGHARLINAEIAQKLGDGNHVAVFPEGTTTDGTHLLHFHAALLQPALNVGRPVVPLAISYWEPNGERSLAPRYDGDISLLSCVQAIAGRKRLIARLVAFPALGLDGADRRSVAARARADILAGAGLLASIPASIEVEGEPAGHPAPPVSTAPEAGVGLLNAC